MKKPKVLITSPLPGESQTCLLPGFELSQNLGEALSHDDLLRSACDKDAIVSVLLNKIDESFFEACPTIKLVANVAVGYDNIDLEAARKSGVLVCNTPGVLTESTADLAFGLMLASARRITESERFLRNGQWKNFALDLLLGTDVHHKTLGILGFGRIGQALAQRARGFSMNIIYHQRRPVAEEIEQDLDALYVSFEDLLCKSDFISIHCPLNGETRHLIGERELAKMKPTAILVNTARGAIVNEGALAFALKNGVIRAAGLDVFECEPKVNEELLNLDNAVLVPHIGSASIETRQAMGRLAVEAVNSAFQGVMPANTVNKEVWTVFLERLARHGCVEKC